MYQFADEDLQDDIVEDDDIDEQLDWEEQLEKEYGGISGEMEEKRTRAMGKGFSKQKQIMEENEFYRGDIKRKVNINDKTKK